MGSETQSVTLDPVKLAYVIADYDRLAARVEELERRVRTNEAIDARRSSIEVGTGAKGGAIKCYVDPFGDQTANTNAMVEMRRLLELAGGKTQESA